MRTQFNCLIGFFILLLTAGFVLAGGNELSSTCKA